MIDITISLTVITTILTFIVIHFIIEPVRRKRVKLEERYKSFYAPLYSIVVQRIGVMKSIPGYKDTLKLGSISKDGKTIEFLTNDYMFDFIIKNSSHASVDLLTEFHRYAYRRFSPASDWESEEFVKLLVKEYALMRRKLKLKYDYREIETGIPGVYQMTN